MLIRLLVAAQLQRLLSCGGAVFFGIVFTLCFTLGAFAQEPASSASDVFKNAVIAFQKGDFKQAQAGFTASLAQDQENPLTLFDLGLVEQKQGHLGLAMALWRKALAVQPDFDPARRALRWGKTKLERADIPHEVETWESFRDTALVGISLSKYLLATAFLLFASGWLLLHYFGERRRARLEERPQPGFPIGGTLAASLCVLTAVLSIAKAFDQETIRGTIVEKKVEARSSPDKGATPLFDLYEGLEVIVQHDSGDWTQVTYPGGSTGWIPKSAVLATNDQVKTREAR